ncbi:MAG TPA: class I SAM-dependent methyltransferase [Micavibrio sp.]
MKPENNDERHEDGSAGDADYGAIGNRYSHYRRPEFRIASFIHKAFADAQTILNVGAGAGSYEPANKVVTAVEPSISMRAQRPEYLSRAIDATAEKLPFDEKSFDASMATFTVHQWRDLEAGLREMRRVTRGPVVILTCAPEEVANFWLNEYAPEVLSTEARRYPPIDEIAKLIGNKVDVLPVPIPLNCVDGFNEAYYGRPEKFLDPGARQSCSAWSFIDSQAAAKFEETLKSDLKEGLWDKKYGHLRSQPEYHGSLKLIIGAP